MTKKVLCKEIDELSFGKEIINLFNKEWGKNYKGEDFFKKDYCEIYKAEIDKNNNIQLWAWLKWSLNNKPSNIWIGVSFDKDLNEDAKDDDYIVNIVDLARKKWNPTFNEDLDTYKVKGCIKNGVLYCCR